MFVHRKSPLRLAVVPCAIYICTVALSACSGGGGSDTNGAGGFTLNHSSFVFSGIEQGPAPASQTLHMHINNLSQVVYVGAGYKSGQAPGWLTIEQPVSSDNADYDFKLDVLAANTHGTLSTVLTVGTADANGNILSQEDVTITYDEKAAILVVDGSLFPLDSVQGNSAKLQLPFSVLADGLQYTMTSDAAWLQPPSGTFTGGALYDNRLAAVDPVGLEPGVHTATLTVSDVADASDTGSIPVTLTVEPNQVVVATHGVALSQFPSHGLLSRSVRISSRNGSKSVAWQAQSDQSWLAVTSSGTTGGSLVMTADATGLAPDQLHVANVAVSSTDPSASNQEVVRVGLWVGSTNPGTSTIAIPFHGNYAGYPEATIQVSPVDPYVFLNNGDNFISVYNIHTGQLVRTYSNLPAGLGEMQVSDDGLKLYVSSFEGVFALNISSGVVSPPLFTGTGGFFAFSRIDGRPVLIDSDSTAYDADTGAKLGSDPVYTGQSSGVPLAGLLATNLDDVYFVAATGQPGVVGHFEYRYSDVHHTLLPIDYNLFLSSTPGVDCQYPDGIAIAPDNSRLYVGCTTSARMPQLDEFTPQAPSSLTYVDALPVYASSSGSVPVSIAWNGVTAAGDSVFDAKGNKLGATSTVAGNIVELGFSGDGKRLASVDSGLSNLVIINTP